MVEEIRDTRAVQLASLIRSIAYSNIVLRTDNAGGKRLYITFHELCSLHNKGVDYLPVLRKKYRWVNAYLLEGWIVVSVDNMKTKKLVESVFLQRVNGGALVTTKNIVKMANGVSLHQAEKIARNLYWARVKRNIIN